MCLLENCIFPQIHTNIICLRKKMGLRCFSKQHSLSKDASSKNRSEHSCSCFWLLQLWTWSLACSAVQTFSDWYSVTNRCSSVSCAVLALFFSPGDDNCVLTKPLLSAFSHIAHLLFPSSSIFKKNILHCPWLFSCSAAQSWLKKQNNKAKSYKICNLSIRKKFLQ